MFSFLILSILVSQRNRTSPPAFSLTCLIGWSRHCLEHLFSHSHLNSFVIQHTRHFSPPILACLHTPLYHLYLQLDSKYTFTSAPCNLIISLGSLSFKHMYCILSCLCFPKLNSTSLDLSPLASCSRYRSECIFKHRSPWRFLFDLSACLSPEQTRMGSLHLELLCHTCSHVLHHSNILNCHFFPPLFLHFITLHTVVLSYNAVHLLRPRCFADFFRAIVHIYSDSVCFYRWQSLCSYLFSGCSLTAAHKRVRKRFFVV